MTKQLTDDENPAENSPSPTAGQGEVQQILQRVDWAFRLFLMACLLLSALVLLAIYLAG